MTNTQKQRRSDDAANERPIANYETAPVSHEQLQREADYIRAQRLLKSLFEKQFISLSEFNKITALNRESFSPMFAEIMP